MRIFVACIYGLILQVKYVIWSKNLEYAALLSKHTLTLVSRKLQVISDSLLYIVIDACRHL